MKITIDGITKNIYYWSLISGISVQTIIARIKVGNSPVDSVFLPTSKRFVAVNKLTGRTVARGATYDELVKITGLAKSSLQTAISRENYNWLITPDYELGQRLFEKAKREGKIK